MNLNECVGIIEQLHDVYGRGIVIGEHTAQLWYKVLGNHDVDDVQASVYAWVREQSKAPRPADLLEGVRAVQRGRVYDGQYHAKPACGVCEGGWVESGIEGRGEVTRCPNGCLPPPPSDLPPLEDSSPPATPEWFTKVRQARLDSEAERKSMGEAAFLELRGFDPAFYRVRDGMIMAKVKEKKKPTNEGVRT